MGARKGMIWRTAAVLALSAASAGLLIASSTVTVLWTAGGLSAGTFSAGQAARMAADLFGNVAIVSGPADGSALAVTSYGPDGAFRWRSDITPSIGVFVGDWIAAAPDGDFVVVGHNVTSSGNPIALTLARFAPDGALLWRIDLARTFPAVARLLVDASGSAYLAFNSVGDGQDIQLHKYTAFGSLVWSRVIATEFFANDVATSLALSADGADVALTGNIVGGATWITAVYDAATGARKWLVTAPEGISTRDVVVDGARVYVTGQGATGGGTPALAYWLTVVAYDRFTGARLWRTDTKPDDAESAAGLRMALSPTGTVVVTGTAARGFLDWYTVSFTTSGAVRWRAVRDGGLNTNEIPSAVLVLEDDTTVVTGPGGPNLAGGFIPGVTAGYDAQGTLLWTAFSKLATVWASALPNGDVCATGGYDAFITCWRISGTTENVPPVAAMTATPSSGDAPLTVAFDASGSSDPDGTIVSWTWSFGDGTSGSGAGATHTYSTAGTYTASLAVTDNDGASSLATRSIVVNGSAPAAPTALTATALSRSSIKLTWANATATQSEVKVERCRGSACTNFVQVATVAGTATTFIDTGLARRTVYKYRVRAHNAYGDSLYSNTASARTLR